MHRRWLPIVSLVGVVFTCGLPPILARQLSARPAEEWIERLERPDRIKSLKIEEILARLRLKPGDIVADLGAGTGVFSVPLSKAVSPAGKVYAVEIEQGLVDYINRKIRDQRVTGVMPVLGKFTDPNLPTKDVDLAFFHDVLHHVQDRAQYLKHLAPYLKTTGRIAVIELDPVTGSHRKEPELQLTKEQVKTLMAAVGFKPAEEFDLFTDKWFVIYTRQ
jgi:ubiquinone/menaquinone biosynthesis C-methylase UbiE